VSGKFLKCWNIEQFCHFSRLITKISSYQITQSPSNQLPKQNYELDTKRNQPPYCGTDVFPGNTGHWFYVVVSTAVGIDARGGLSEALSDYELVQ